MTIGYDHRMLVVTIGLYHLEDRNYAVRKIVFHIKIANSYAAKLRCLGVDRRVKQYSALNPPGVVETC